MRGFLVAGLAPTFPSPLADVNAFAQVDARARSRHARRVPIEEKPEGWAGVWLPLDPRAREGTRENAYGSGWFRVEACEALLIELEAPDAHLWSFGLATSGVARHEQRVQ